jgi:hypothetical protein
MRKFMMAIAVFTLSIALPTIAHAVGFSTVGLSPNSQTLVAGGSASLQAFVQSSNNQPVPGATINFVVSGVNAGATGTAVPASFTTGGDGKVTFTYTDSKGPGIDTVQAFIGTLGSNVVTVNWVTSDPVPEPSSLILLGNGALGLIGIMRRKCVSEFLSARFS